MTSREVAGFSPGTERSSVGGRSALSFFVVVGTAVALLGSAVTSALATFERVGDPIPEIEPVDFSGWSVAASSDGSRLAVGSPSSSLGTLESPSSCETSSQLGRVRVFDWTATGWTQFGSTIEGELPCEGFGKSVALSADGSLLAIGAEGDGSELTPQAFVVVFELQGTEWVRRGDAVDPATGPDDQGRFVALSADGERLAVGAPTTNGLRGRVRLFDWDGSRWNQAGGDLVGPVLPAGLGAAVALSADGNRVAIGSPVDGTINDEFFPGAVYVYDWQGSAWIQAGSTIQGFANAAQGDDLGFAVELSADGNRLAASSPGGYVRVLEWVGDDWSPMGPDVSFSRVPDPLDPSQYLQPAPRFGWSLGFSAGGDRLAVGVPEWGCDRFCGVVDLFDWDGVAWSFQGGVGGSEESYFGWSAVLTAEGTRLVAGAPGGAAPGYVSVYDIVEAPATTTTTTTLAAPTTTISEPVAKMLPETGGGSGSGTLIAVALGVLLAGVGLAIAGRRRPAAQ